MKQVSKKRLDGRVESAPARIFRHNSKEKQVFSEAPDRR